MHEGEGAMNHCLSWLRLEVGCRILTGRGVKFYCSCLATPILTPSTAFRKVSLAKDGGTEAGSYCCGPFYEAVRSAVRQYFLLALPSLLPSGLEPRQL